MRVQFRCQPGWQRDRAIFEQIKKAIADVGKLADEKPSGPRAGYLAERPLTMPNCLRVWAPCDCCWTYMNASTSVLTQCEDDKAPIFDWMEAEKVLRAFLEAEQQQKIEEGAPSGESEREKLAIVKLPSA